MLPPIPVPDAAARLNAMAQQSALAPIQQAGGMRGQVFTPSGGAAQGGIMDGIPGLMAGVKDLAGMVKQNRDTEALASFVKGALGEETLPEGATPVEGLPWLGGQQGQQALPPIPPPGGSAPTPTASRTAPANPLGFDERQVGILRGMLETGDRAQLERAAGLVMTRAFAGPPEAQSTIGKLIHDYEKLGGSDPRILQMYEDAIAKETAPAEPKDSRTPTMKDYEYAVEKDGYKGTFTQYQLERAKAGASSVQVNTGDNAYAKKRGEQLATARQEIADRAQTARGTRSRVQQTMKLLDETNTGALAPTFQSAKRVAKALGVDLAGMGITDDVSAAENFTSIAGQFMMDYIQQTKGAISEAENRLFLSFSPELGKTKEGNKMLLDWADAVAKREIDLNRLATKYEKENGQLDAGWEDVKAKWQDDNPIIDVKKAEAIIGSAGPDTMSPSSPGVSAPLPPMGVPAEPSKLSDQEVLEQLRKQGYPIPRTQ